MLFFYGQRIYLKELSPIKRKKQKNDKKRNGKSE